MVFFKSTIFNKKQLCHKSHGFYSNFHKPFYLCIRNTVEISAEWTYWVIIYINKMQEIKFSVSWGLAIAYTCVNTASNKE